MRTMEIIFDGRCITDNFPGVGRYAYRLLEQITSLPEAPDLLALVPREGNSRFDISRLRVSALPVRAHLFDPLGQVILGLKLRRRRTDLCHFPYLMHPLGTRIPHVVTIHDLIPIYHPEELPSKAKRWGYLAALQIAIRNAEALIVPSRSVEADLRRRFGKKLRISVTPYGLDASFRRWEDPCEVLRFHGLQPGYLLTVSSHRPHKNLRFLLEVYRGVRQAHRAPPLVIVGPTGPSTTELLRCIETWDLRGSVHLLGSVPEDHLPALYSGALLFLYPSLMEGFGFPPLEARACGCPTIVSDIPALRETHGPGSLLLPPGRTELWAEEILALLSDPTRSEELAREAEQVRDTYTWEQTARLTLKVYAEVVP